MQRAAAHTMQHTGDVSIRALAAVSLTALIACSSPGSDEEPAASSSTEAITSTSPVSAAVTTTCSTTAVKGLATQLVEEIQCLKPGSLMRIDNEKGLSLGAAVFPYLQTPAAKGLLAAQKARGVTMSINSALRALPQQYLLYRWYQTGRCGIALAAKPGTSNHESALAVDVNDYTGWRATMEGKGFRWFGSADVVHFDFVGDGRVDLKGDDVRAFQRLWNRNHADDQIDVDGAYGPATEARLAKAPVGGFPIGAKCDTKEAGAPEQDAGSSDPGDVPVVPDGEEPQTDAPEAAAPVTPPPPPSTPDHAPSPQAGCNTSSSSPTTLIPLALALAGLGLRRRRR
jgi:uncharacterized protein (TIGR03382 family)